MKIIITGGHPTPALALIDELKKYKNIEIIFVGRKHPIIREKNYSFEYQEIKKRNIKFIDLKTGKFIRYFSLDFFINLLLFIIGFFDSLKILIFEKPDLVFSFGGYLALPIAFWAWIFKIPILIHEQTVSPGLANRMISFFAKRVLVAFPQAGKFFNQKKTIVVGNPIRFKNIKLTGKSKKNNKQKPVIYITGGSLGSHIINLHLEKILPFLLNKYKVIHQTGNISQFNDFNRLKYKFKNSDYFLFSHINTKKLQEIYESADLVICRGGANTFFELIAFQKPAIFIPLPFSASDEQKKHALIFYKNGAGEIFNQNEDSFKLLKLIDKMINNLDLYKNNLRKLKNLYQKNATEKIISIIFRFAKKD